METYKGEKLTKRIQRRFVVERDWGANLVAEDIETSGTFGIYDRSNSKMSFDFGRFPGSTRDGATQFGRFAINTPPSHNGSIMIKNEHCWKITMTPFPTQWKNNFEENSSKSPFIPMILIMKVEQNVLIVSLVTRTIGYQLESRMPFGVFDPLYPDILAEFTVDRVLRDRISLTLEKTAFQSHTTIPISSQKEVPKYVTLFGDFYVVAKPFGIVYPETKGDPAYERVWEMLQDTNLRSAQVGELRSVLHMHRRPLWRQQDCMNILLMPIATFHFVNQDNRKKL